MTETCRDRPETQPEPGPLILAHRGSSRDAPENTLAAFELAISQGADGVETDVRLSRDGIPVLCHDRDLERVAGRRVAVADLTAAELAAIAVGRGFRGALSQARLPTLAALLDWAAGQRTARGRRPLLNLELKADEPGREPGLADRVVALLRSRGMAGDCAISSFDPTLVARARALAPEISVGLLLADRPPDAAEPDPWNFYAVRADRITATVVDRARSRGRAVWAWTADDGDAAIALASWGVAAIITNVPARIVSALARRG